MSLIISFWASRECIWVSWWLPSLDCRPLRCLVLVFWFILDLAFFSQLPPSVLAEAQRRENTKARASRHSQTDCHRHACGRVYGHSAKHFRSSIIVESFGPGREHLQLAGHWLFCACVGAGRSFVCDVAAASDALAQGVFVIGVGIGVTENAAS